MKILDYAYRILGLSFLFLKGTLAAGQVDPTSIPGCLLWLDAAQSVDSTGDVVNCWNNLARNDYHAVQSIDASKPMLLHEAWSGHTVIHFDGVDDHLIIQNSISDFQFSDEFTVFVVGRVTARDSSGPGGFIGNFSTGSDYKEGWCMRTRTDGTYDLLLGNGKWNQAEGGSVAFADDFVLLNGLYANESGSGRMYCYSSLSEVETSKGLSPLNLVNSNKELVIGMYLNSGSTVLDQAVECDIAEIIIYDKGLSDTDRSAIWDGLIEKYSLSVGNPTFYVEDFSPSLSLPSAYEVSADEPIAIRFNSAIDMSTIDSILVARYGADGYPQGSNWSSVSGSWSASSGGTVATFTPSLPFNKGELIIVKIGASLMNADGSAYAEGADSRFSFITENNSNYPVSTTVNMSMATVQHDDGSDHFLPIEMIVPDTGSPVPVMFWVHGGGWSGGDSGTMASSELKNATYPDFLARKLGIAVANVTWRSLNNSEGTFAKAVNDVELAIQYVRDNASAYNIDTSRMGLYGGSAGTPMSSLISQLDTNVVCYVGLNGLYDFANRTGSPGFGNGNAFSQDIPSLEANSAINSIRVPGPDTLLLHGDMDSTIEHEQSIYYADAINDAGGFAKALIYSGEAHAFFNPGNPAHIPTMYEVGKHLTRVFALEPQDSTSASPNTLATWDAGTSGTPDYGLSGTTSDLTGATGDNRSDNSDDGTSGSRTEKPVPGLANTSFTVKVQDVVRLDFTNNTGADINLKGFYFDYNRLFVGSPQDFTVEYASGDLADIAPVIIYSITESKRGAWENHDALISAALTDHVLADGESATFTISFNNGGASAGALDNIMLLKSDPDLVDEVVRWAQAEPYNLSAPDDARTADPDSDGYSNEFEYYFGMNPRDSGNQAANKKAPFAHVVTNNSLDYLAITFAYRIDNPSINYKIWTSNDLSRWTDEGDPMSSENFTVVTDRLPGNDDLTATATVKYNRDFAAHSKFFLKLDAKE